ncbi:epoxide hydrolase 2-like isoform X2 [Typha angustifolia]|uniref:epoxide hydrolase 2-like isoform X2 n=1 Tax=Typha angustifolia TaxID=59011 RepID=UPI003C2F52EF
MEKKIDHSYLKIRGLSLHIAHIGTGELGTVVFVHGFPEIWYSWRHQMVAAAEAGFRAIAPDLRGFGLSQQPSNLENFSWEDLVADLLAILDSFHIPKAFFVAKDFGAKPVFDLALYHSDKVLGVVTLGVPPTVSSFCNSLPEGFYICRWREPGRAEADFGRFSVERVLRTIYILFSRSEVPIAKEGQEIMDLANSSTPLPWWFTDEDLAMTVAKNPSISNPKFEVPMFLIMGEKDYFIKFPKVEDYISSGMVRNFAPDLEITFIPEGSHFVQEQFPDHVNQLIVSFLMKHI